MADVKLFCGDCLEVLPTLEAGSIDAILTDLPYGTTACSWDTVIPFYDFMTIQGKTFYHNEAIERLMHFALSEEEAEEKPKEKEQ